MDIHVNQILILDFGSQYTQLIARRVRESGVYCEIHPWDQDEKILQNFKPAGIILSGGPESVNLDNPPIAPEFLFDLSVPILGICYGMQTMAKQLGGKVEASSEREYGYAEVEPSNSFLLDGLSDNDTGLLKVWMSHGDRVESIPEGFVASASSKNSPFAVMEDTKRKFFGLQFHPEVTHTLKGKEIIDKFVHEICGCLHEWTPSNIASEAIKEVKAKVGDGEVLLGLSGGVDSSVVAAILHNAIGSQLTCVFVDHGLLRFNEGDQVMKTFKENLGVNVIRVNAANRFFKALKGI